MSPRLPAQRIPPITFAHRGARAVAQENTLDAFTKALKMGASGLESDVWLTADGVPVLDHDGWGGRHLRRLFRRSRISSLRRADLPAHIPTLEELYGVCGTKIELSLDVKDPAAFAPVVAVAQAAGAEAPEHLWLCHPDWHQLVTWRGTPEGRASGVRLVDSTRLRHMKEGPERRAANLADAGIDAVNMHYLDWSGGLGAVFHRFDILAFAWDAQLPRVLREMLDLGIDAVYSDHVDRMVDALADIY
jgi:glycerophosphoryl diester phosphodiesterase